MDRPRLDPLTTTQEGVSDSEQLFYIGVAGSSPRESATVNQIATKGLRMNATAHDLVLGLDRSDKKADLRLIDTRTGQRRGVTARGGAGAGAAAAGHPGRPPRTFR